MLSEAVRPYIDASVPVLREHGVAITTHFYASMFAAHPELKNLPVVLMTAFGSVHTAVDAAPNSTSCVASSIVKCAPSPPRRT